MQLVAFGTVATINAQAFEAISAALLSDQQTLGFRLFTRFGW